MSLVVKRTPVTDEKAVQATAARIHRGNIVWNICDTTLLPHADESYIAEVVQSGMSATFHTVCVFEGIADSVNLMGKWRRIYEEHDKLMPGLTAEDSKTAKKTNRTAMYMAWQDILSLEGRLDLLDAYYYLGLRVVQPTYQSRNLAGDGCGERKQTGLSRFGIELVRRCNELGIALDVSHVSDATTVDMIEFSKSPVIASHVGAAGLNKNIRNKSDDIIRALVGSGGIIGIAGKSGFLRSDGLTKGATVDDYVDHIAYVADLVGVDHVCIGTDIADARKYSKSFLEVFHKRFPEVSLVDANSTPDAVHPTGLKSPKDLPNITAALVRRGFSDEEVQKIIGGNVERILPALLKAYH